MGVMNKMRESAGKVIIWVLVIAFGGLWMLQDSGAFDSIGVGGGQNIAEVNGEMVTLEQYNAAVENQLEVYRQQTGGQEIPVSVQNQIRQEVFDALVDNQLREQEMARLGIDVTDEEVDALIYGPNPHPIILQVFGDGQGGVNQAALAEAAQQAQGNDEEAQAIRAQLIQIEDYIRQERRAQKLDALIEATARVTDADVTAELVRRNAEAEVEFVALRLADLPADEVEVTAGDLRAYYNEHREDFERPRTYAFEYVLVPRTATAEDTTRAVEELQALKADFAAAADPETFARRATSDAEIGTNYLTPAQLAAEVSAAVYDDPQVGTVVGPVIGNGQAELVRITGLREAAQPYARARHILFSTRDASAEDALAAANAALAQLRGGANFAALARRLSDDGTETSGSRSRGGDLGWFARNGQMVAPFEAAVFSAPVGQVVGPVQTDFGYHLILVEDRTSQEAEVVRITRLVEGSFEAARELALDLQEFAGERGFTEEAASRDLSVQTQVVTDEQAFVPGLDVGAEAIQFLRTADEGDISDPLDAGGDYVLLHLTEIQPEGYRSLEEVRDEVQNRVLIEKRRAIQAQRMREALEGAGSLTALATALGTEVQTAPGVRLSTPLVAGLGREPRFVGTAFGLAEGRISGVIEGEASVFVLRPTRITRPAPDSFSDEERQQVREQLLNQRRQQIRTAWMDGLREDADIEDFRARLQTV